MNKQQLVAQIRKKQSFLCVGLDTDINKIPVHLKEEFENPILEFNKQIIDATKEFCVAYKPNIAFYESLGAKGWEILKETLAYIPKDIFTIADAKRGDIGNTANLYAKTFFETYNFDSVTVAPYMGKDSVSPFLAFKNKWTILLGLTSNPSAADFEQLELKSGDKLFEQVLKSAKNWSTSDQLMFVVGATQAADLKKIRSIIPEHFLLVPGVGAQGGSLSEVCKYGLTKDVGLLVNSSRGVIYASQGKDFSKAAQSVAATIQKEMAGFID